jgi:hypothetical protein
MSLLRMRRTQFASQVSSVRAPSVPPPHTTFTTRRILRTEACATRCESLAQRVNRVENRNDRPQGCLGLMAWTAGYCTSNG